MAGLNKSDDGTVNVDERDRQVQKILQRYFFFSISHLSSEYFIRTGWFSLSSVSIKTSTKSLKMLQIIKMHTNIFIFFLNFSPAFLKELNKAVEQQMKSGESGTAAGILALQKHISQATGSGTILIYIGQYMNNWLCYCFEKVWLQNLSFQLMTLKMVFPQLMLMGRNLSVVKWLLCTDWLTTLAGPKQSIITSL